MSITVHLFTAAPVQRCIETAEVRLFVVGIFALGIGVMNDRTEAYAVTDGCPLQHLDIAVGISERGRRRPILSLFPTDLPVLPSIKLTSGNRNSVGILSRIWNLLSMDDRTPCSGRSAVHFLGPRAHELDAANRHDECHEAVSPQIRKQFEHRLVNQLGIGPIERGSRAAASQSVTIFENSSVVMPAWVTMISSTRPRSPDSVRAIVSPSSTDGKAPCTSLPDTGEPAPSRLIPRC
jgi:hypothetical protein